jgi:hypothetical protein
MASKTFLFGTNLSGKNLTEILREGKRSIVVLLNTGVEVRRARVEAQLFILLVKPEHKTDLSPTYLMNFSSPEKPKPEV